jgi:Chaperone of endosialidase
MNSSTNHLPTSTGSTRRVWLLIPAALACFGLSPALRAVSPPPDGGYPNGNTAEGTNALLNLTSGVWNTAVGQQALSNATTGNQNTGVGYQTLFSTTTGSLSVATGSQTLYNNTSGSFNTATGFRALYSNTTGSDNTANGFEALNSNTSANNNTAFGFKALYINTTGHDNVATGYQAMYSNASGNYNMANGQQALYSNTTGYQNTANGVQALFHNTDGASNTAYGFTALAFNVDGNQNTAVGFNALFHSTGDRNVALGQAAGFNLTSGDDNIYIGNQGPSTESDTIRIGDPAIQSSTFIAGIADATVTGSAVVVDLGTGQLGVAPSSERFKDAIESMGNASDVLLSLRPVKFRYKENIDPKGAPQFGLVAEEVEKVDPNLVVRDAKGKVFTVRYEAVNAMLLNEFLKEHRTVQEQQKQIQALAVQLKEQGALLQKVSDRLELNKPAPQMAVSNQ